MNRPFFTSTGGVASPLVPAPEVPPVQGREPSRATLHTIIPGRLYTSSWPNAKRIPELEEAGITAILCVTPRRADPEVKKWATTRGFYWRAPLTDGKYVNGTHLSAGQTVARLVSNGHVVLVHCNAGRNRAGLMAAIALLELGYCTTGEEAIARVRAARPRALANPAFEAYLLREFAC